jgi:serine/threonine protein kinase
MARPNRSQWKRVDVVVPAGPLGLIVSKCPTGEGHVVVDGFRPVGPSAEPGALEEQGEIGPLSLLLGVNEHDFTDTAAAWSFEKIREILVSTSNAERVVRFLVPPPPPMVQFEELAAHKTQSRFADEYTLGKELGAGTFSVVREATHKATGEKFAIKCIKRAQLSSEDLTALVAEVKILREMQHPHIVKLYDVFQEDKYFFLVTEYMPGGELFERIVKKNFYSEREARDLVKVLLDTIAFCHDADVVHRDLKPENLLLSSLEDDADIKLADFGFAKKSAIQNGDAGLVTACGTPGYVAPEILASKPYGKEVDIWSIGVITYILLCGYPPFHHDNQGVLFRLIKAGRFEFDSPYWDDVSAEAKDLISKMLVLKPAERWTARQLLEHPWIAGDAVKDVQLTTALQELRKFNARRKFRAAVSTVKATISLTKALTLGGSPRSTKGSGDEGDKPAQNVVNASAAASAAPPPAPTASQ